MLKASLVVLALAVLAGICVADDFCGQYNLTCEQCTSHYGCGWCLMNDTCMSGWEEGTYDLSCSWENWSYTSGGCNASHGAPTPSGCPAYLTCNACTSSPGCGWCAASETCMPGGAFQSDDGSCNSTNWTYLQYNCPPGPGDRQPPDLCAGYILIISIFGIGLTFARKR